jgi:hypothetical protein
MNPDSSHSVNCVYCFENTIGFLCQDVTLTFVTLCSLLREQGCQDVAFCPGTKLMQEGHSR